jgi:hypothetical protein
VQKGVSKIQDSGINAVEVEFAAEESGFLEAAKGCLITRHRPPPSS